MANPDKNKAYKDNLSNSYSLYLKATLLNLLIWIKYLLTYCVLNTELVFQRTYMCRWKINSFWPQVIYLVMEKIKQVCKYSTTPKKINTWGRW